MDTKEKVNFAADDLKVLNQLGIDIVSEDRNYWFVRTNGGQYFDDFYMEEYIGIEWDKIVPTSLVDFEVLKERVQETYPKEERPGYVASQIYKFVSVFKKGDIVIIPNKDSKFFAFGELTDDGITVMEENLTDTLIFPDEEEKTVFLKKRRRVKWLKAISRAQLDSHLQTFIYAHNTIVDLHAYSLYIDRTLSQFYIKGEQAYYTLAVCKQDNIPFEAMCDLLVLNRNIIELINKFIPEYSISYSDIIAKIDVQSRGPFQLTGPMKKVLLIGIISMFIMGGHISIMKDGIEISSNGIVEVINTAINAYDVYKTHQENNIEEQYSDLEAQFKKSQEQLELTTPISGNDVVIEISDDTRMDPEQ